MACSVPDFNQPRAAGVYQYLLGGTGGHLPADAVLAEAMMEPEKGCPGLRELARENRRFVVTATRWVASMRNISQFIDLGCGHPAAEMTHDAARQGGATRAAVVYVDNDPLVVRRVKAVVAADGPGMAVCKRDAAAPASVLADEELLEVIDLEQPVALIFGATLSAMSAEVARAAVAGFAEALVPGSAAVISCVSYADQGLAGRLAGLYGQAAPWFNHSPEDVAGFFEAGGLRLVHGRVMDTHCWPACDVRAGTRAAAVIGGVGVKD